MSDVEDVFGLSGLVLDNKFAIDAPIAQGGFAVVYRARHQLLDRVIALKVLRAPDGFTAEQQQHFLDGFVREARAMAKLDHPNIVQVLDFGVSTMPLRGECPWMAMEWLEGPTLREELMKRRREGYQGRSPGETLALLGPAIEALATAHEQGIAHRDLKPSNMMLVQTRRGPALKVFDFGIAKEMSADEGLGSGETRTSAQIQAYSLQYAAPEQLGGTRTGPWTDVHALALIVTELLSDQPPYHGDDRTEVMARVLAADRPTPLRRGVQVGAWESVLDRALALRPATRFANAGEFLYALQSALPPGSYPQQTMAPPTGAFPQQTGGYPQQTMAPPGAVPPATPITLTGPGGGSWGTFNPMTGPGNTSAVPATPKRSLAPLLALLGLFGLGIGGVVVWRVMVSRAAVASVVTASPVLLAPPTPTPALQAILPPAALVPPMPVQAPPPAAPPAVVPALAPTPVGPPAVVPVPVAAPPGTPPAVTPERPGHHHPTTPRRHGGLDIS